ncbi:hypothetical protein SLA2020_291860 [Shorea laevis]
MAVSSLSTLPCTPSFPPNSNDDSLSTSASLRPISLKLFKPHHLLRKSASLRHSNPQFKAFASLSNLSVEHGSATEQFLRNNSVTRFLRFKRGSGGGCVGELQAAHVSYRMRFPRSLGNPSVQVDLVSTVHIADKEYFEMLQKTLAPYDCVLYEMVTSRENLEKKSDTTMKAENWYHADLDFETFNLLQFEKDENFFTFVRDMNHRSTKLMAQPASIQSDLDTWGSKLLWVSCVLPLPLVILLICPEDFAGNESHFL